jgi:hypothetical protein
MSHELRRHAVPVRVEVGGDGIEEGEQGAVGRLLPAVEHRRVQRTAQRVGAQVVQASVAHGRRRGDLVEDALCHRPDPLLDRSRALRRDRTGCAREVEEVRAFGIVEPKRPRQRFEHELRGAADVPAL